MWRRARPCGAERLEKGGFGLCHPFGADADLREEPCHWAESAAEPQLKTAFEMRSERHIKAKELCSGLLKFGGLYCAEQLRELLNKMEESLEGEKIVPVQFYEFLVCCRRLQDMVLNSAMEEFDNLDADEDGIIEGEELREFCKPLGFTLSNDEWEELLEEQEVSPDDDIDFEGAWNFLKGPVLSSLCGLLNGWTDRRRSFASRTGPMGNLLVETCAEEEWLHSNGAGGVGRSLSSLQR
ncbi:unnamed protein product [Durusdinium trenchii]|uniref:EF-hand domain-containing protein n=1 Tax=Durusdinium trenchii TaxID=1381693 RepID=A0ABP0K212_9DINO